MKIDWQPYETVPKSENEYILIMDELGRRYIAEWDDNVGYFYSVEDLDGVEREKFYQEINGKIYGAKFWAPYNIEHIFQCRAEFDLVQRLKNEI